MLKNKKNYLKKMSGIFVRSETFRSEQTSLSPSAAVEVML